MLNPINFPLPAASLLTSLTTEPMHELAMDFSPSEYRVKWVESAWERQQAYALRRAVFCEEQHVFAGDDLDDIDEHAQLIVAVTCLAGMPDEVVGTVRIYEAEPGVWWGSRLAVAAAYRSHGKLGATLIRLAVTSAHALGCKQFFAHVQSQNVPLFRRLRWRSLQELDLHGRMHHLMLADLNHYPPCHAPFTGFVTPAVMRGVK
jgi:putative N-acetyltransferase (TIGR04045 family)